MLQLLQRVEAFFTNLSQREIVVALSFITLLTALVAYYASTEGLIFTSDSFHYWAASRSFLNKFTFIGATGEQYVYWPPLFPVLLSLFEESYYHIFQLVLISFLPWLLFYLFKARKNTLIAFLVIILWTLSVYPYLMSSFLWSEVIFTFLLYAALNFLRIHQADGNNSHLHFAFILFALLCLQRNAGVFILIGLSFYYFLQFLRSELNVRQLIKMAMIILVSVIPLLAWNAYNAQFFAEEFDFDQYIYANDIFHNFQGIALSFSEMIYPLIDQENNLLALIIFFLMLYFTLFTSKNEALLKIILIFYLIGFLLMPKITYDTMDRFMSPVIPIVFYLLGSNWQRSWKGTIRLTISSLLLLLILFAGSVRLVKNVNLWHERSLNNRKGAKIYAVILSTEPIESLFYKGEKKFSLPENKAVNQ